MKDEERRYYETDTSYISVVGNSMEIKKKNGAKKKFGTIEVFDGLSIELGRTVDELQDLFRILEMPVIIIHLDWHRPFRYKKYYLCELIWGYCDEDGLFGHLVLGWFMCTKEDGTIFRFDCDREHFKNRDELKCDDGSTFAKIGDLWKIEIPHTEDEDENKKRVQKFVEDLIGASEDESFVIHTTCDGVKIFVNVKNEEIDCKYLFIFDERVNAYIFSMIELNEKNI